MSVLSPASLKQKIATDQLTGYPAQRLAYLFDLNLVHFPKLIPHVESERTKFQSIVEFWRANANA